MISKEVNLVMNKVQENDITEEDLLDSPNGFYEQIKVVDVLETSQRDDLLQVIHSKLKSGGTAVLTGLEGFELCRKVYSGQLGFVEFSRNIIVNVNRIHSLFDLTFMLQNGFNVDYIGMRDDRYHIEVTKV